MIVKNLLHAVYKMVLIKAMVLYLAKAEGINLAFHSKNYRKKACCFIKYKIRNIIRYRNYTFRTIHLIKAKVIKITNFKRIKMEILINIKLSTIKININKLN